MHRQRFEARSTFVPVLTATMAVIVLVLGTPASALAQTYVGPPPNGGPPVLVGPPPYVGPPPNVGPPVLVVTPPYVGTPPYAGTVLVSTPPSTRMAAHAAPVVRPGEPATVEVTRPGPAGTAGPDPLMVSNNTPVTRGDLAGLLAMATIAASAFGAVALRRRLR